LKKSEDIIVKRNEEVTCSSCYLLANAVEWWWISSHQPSVRSLRPFFLSFRVRNSKFLGFSRPELLVSRTQKYLASFSYSCLWRKLANYFRVQFSCSTGFFFSFIIYYAFKLVRRKWIIPMKLVFALCHYPFLANEDFCKCVQQL